MTELGRQLKLQARWFLWPDCAPSVERPRSKCPKFGTPPSFDRCTPQRRRLNQNITLSVLLLQQCHCRNCHRGKLQNLSPPSLSFESSGIFLQYTEDTDAKKWLTRILKFEFCDFWEFFEIFKKASRGPSAADLDYYGRGQTRSE